MLSCVVASIIGNTRVGGINRQRARTTQHAVVADTARTDGFSATDLTAKVNTITGTRSAKHATTCANFAVTN